jgi:hypothetical protein
MSRRLALWLGIVAALLLADTAAAQIRLLYDVDFGRPPHLAGSPPALGADPAPRKTPTSIPMGDPRVVATQGAMTEQPCAFGNGTTGYDQLMFAVDPGHPDGFPDAYSVYFAEMDLLVEPLTGSELFRLFFDCPTVNYIEFHADGSISVSPSGATIGTFAPGVPFHLEVELDFPSASWSIWLDGRLVHTGQLIGTYLRAFRFNLQGVDVANQVALDDLRLYGGSLPEWTDLLYDVDFAWPPHHVHVPPVLGTGPAPRKVPTEIFIGDPTVVPSLGALTEWPCSFGNGTEGYDQLRCYVSSSQPQGFPVDYGAYLLSVDVLIASMPAGDMFKVFCDAPLIHYVAFRSDGTIFLYPGDFVAGVYTFGVPVNVMIEVDTVADTWSVLLDGALVYIGATEADQFNCFRLSLAPGYANTVIGADNIYLWGVGMLGAAVEEPGGPRPVALRAFPNPAQEGAWIRWAAPQAGPVVVDVMSVDGRRLWSREHPAAAGQLRWQGLDDLGAALPSGVYFVRVLSGGEEIGRQPLILRR